MGQSLAMQLMQDFARRTGLLGGAEAKRYLWTDAFAVLNFLELHRRTGNDDWLELASGLVDQVHSILGRHRPDDPRSGWLSGLSQEDGAAHPTAGGLRIGKPLPERSAAEPPHERLEWERDGQYFHYLTKWMDALSRMGVLLRDRRYRRWASELADGVFPRFLRTNIAGIPVGLAWKMSIDLSRPQVPGMSVHDALDAYVTFRWLDAGYCAGPVSADKTKVLGELVEGRRFETEDPLGLGGLLLDAFRLALLPDCSEGEERIIGEILRSVVRGLESFATEGTLGQPAGRRLGFRELGLAIGLQTLEPLALAVGNLRASSEDVAIRITKLHSQAAVANQIVEFWQSPEALRSPTWKGHQDINEVMLATALLKAQIGTAEL